jgi:hydroxyethylthiazole kinase
MSMNQQCADALESMRKAVPLCHCITNYVSMDVMANTLLAIGASPIMVCAAMHRHP